MKASELNIKNSDKYYIKFWQEKLELLDWTITALSIEGCQVMYDDDIPEEDRYFVGVWRDIVAKVAVIYHDRDLTREYVLHELLHIKFPKFTEDQVNNWCSKLLKIEL